MANILTSQATLGGYRSIFRNLERQAFQSIDLHDADLRRMIIWTSDLSDANFSQADMPPPDSPEWNSLIAKTVETGEYTHLNPASYSQELKQLLRGGGLDLRNVRESSLLAQRLRDLLSFLRRPS